MFLLALGKARTGAALDNPVLRTEGRVTLIDGVLASAVTLALVLNAGLGWWWADPAAGYVLVYYGAREARARLCGLELPGNAAGPAPRLGTTIRLSLFGVLPTTPWQLLGSCVTIGS